MKEFLKKHYNKIVIAVIMILAIVLIVELTILSPSVNSSAASQDAPVSSPEETAPADSVSQETVPATAPAEASILPYIPDNSSSLEDSTLIPPRDVMVSAGLETPCGSFDFASTWGDSLRFEDRSDDTRFIAVAYGTSGDKEAELFTIYMGQGGTEGYLLGTLPNRDGTPTEIRFTVARFDPDDTWSQEDRNAIYAMQEGINDFVSQVQNSDGFIPAA